LATSQTQNSPTHLEHGTLIHALNITLHYRNG